VLYIDVAKVDRDVAHVAMMFSSVCFKCFICFRRMLQVFHLDVVKVNLDFAYTCMLQAYVFSVSGVSYVCCKCFIWMLHMFCTGYNVFSWCSRHMLQVFQLFWMYVASVSSRYCKK
jgi:hypothetical protein